jgi:hypothetical protein
MNNPEQVYTARNRDRDHASSYGTPGTAQQEHTIEKRLQESLRKAKAVRIANRLAQDMRARTNANPTECGFARISFQLNAIREAENVDALLYRDRFADGMITAALVFGIIRFPAYDRLTSLRHSAFQHRNRELQPCTL